MLIEAWLIWFFSVHISFNASERLLYIFEIIYIRFASLLVQEAFVTVLLLHLCLVKFNLEKWQKIRTTNILVMGQAASKLHEDHADGVDNGIYRSRREWLGRTHYLLALERWDGGGQKLRLQYPALVDKRECIDYSVPSEILNCSYVWQVRIKS